MRPIDADVLLEKVREIRKLALDRVLETPDYTTYPIFHNPAYTRYSTQADEREKFKVMIEEAPTVNALNCSEFPNNWIPCSERLPKESRKYLVTVLDGIGKRTTSAPYHRRSKSWTLTGRMAYWQVIAWMPLPEPYQGGKQK